MKHETSVALYALWQSCQGRAALSADQIGMPELHPVLPSLLLLELDAGFRVRFCGAAVARRYGRDLRGEDFLALWKEGDAQALCRLGNSMMRHANGLVCGVMAETAGGGFTSFELLLLPLVGERRPVAAIGSMARVGGHDELNRFRARILAQSLRSMRLLPGPARHGALPPTLPPAPPDPLRRHRHLTVVNGGASCAPSP